MTYLFLILALLLNSLAHIVLKLGALGGLWLNSLNPIQLIINNYLAVLSASFFGVSFFFYFLALRTVPLSVAFPVVIVASVLIINSFAYFYLRETISLWQALGYLLIVAGILLVFFTGK